MPKTAVADIIIPTVFEKYAIERTAELSRFGESGIVEMSAEFDELAAGGGREVKMPFWKDLSANAQVNGRICHAKKPFSSQNFSKSFDQKFLERNPSPTSPGRSKSDPLPLP